VANRGWTIEYPLHIWASPDWFERLILIVLGLLLAYTVFVFTRFFYRYCSARRQSREFVPDSTHAFRRNQKGIIAELSHGAETLKSIASTAPFLGLAGTCYGILAVLFRGYVGSKGAFVAMISSETAAALVTTAGGLVVAIPAAAFYNILRTRVEIVESGLSDTPLTSSSQSFQFAQKLPLQRQFASMPPFALIAAPGLAVLLALYVAFSSSPLCEVAKGLHMGIAPARCEYAGGDRRIVLRITDAGSLFLSNVPEDWSRLPTRLSEIYSDRVRRVLYLSADDGVPFQTVADAIDIAQNVPVTAGSPAVRIGTDRLNIAVLLVTPTAMNDHCPEPVVTGSRQRRAREQ
jgi:biopolymer transport protein ExbD